MDVIDGLPLSLFDDDVFAATRFHTSPESSSSGTGASSYRQEAMVHTLQIASQVARHSETHLNALCRMFTARKLYVALQCSVAVIRAKTCNLIGNLCR
jgi:hypothetical protein